MYLIRKMNLKGFLYLCQIIDPFETTKENNFGDCWAFWYQTTADDDSSAAKVVLLDFWTLLYSGVSNALQMVTGKQQIN